MKFWAIATATVLFASAAAADSTWRVDSFSYFHVPSAGVIRQLHGGMLPLEVAASGEGRWSVRLPASQMGSSSFQSGNYQVTVTANTDGVGELVAEGGLFRGSLTLRLRIAGNLQGQPIDVPFALTLTTGHAEVGAGSTRAEIDGVPLDPSSGQLQLVAVGTNPPGLGAISGQPFYVVLSGRLENLPSEMRAPLDAAQ